MNTKRIALFLLGLGTLFVSIGLQLKSSTQNAIDACTSRNSVNTSMGFGDTYTCSSMTMAWIVLGVGLAVLFGGVVLSVGHSRRSREWILVWTAVGVWAIGLMLLYV